MGLTVDTIGVDIVARIDKLEAGLRQAEAKVGASADRMADNAKKKAGFFSKSAFQQNFVKGLAAAFLLDRGFSAINEGLKTVEQNLNLARAGVYSYGQAWAEVAVTIAKALPVIGSAFETGGTIGRMLFRQEGDSRYTSRGEEIIGGIRERAEAARAESLGGSKTKAGIEALAQNAMKKLQQEIADATALFLKKTDLGYDQYTPAELKAFMGAINEYERDAAAAIERNKQDQLKGLQKTGAIFDTFNTAFGAMKVAVRGAPTKQDKAAEDTAKNTKGIDNKLGLMLQRGGAIVAFG